MLLFNWLGVTNLVKSHLSAYLGIQNDLVRCEHNCTIFAWSVRKVAQCSSVMVSRKKMYKICHYTHHFIWCFANWNLVSNKYFNYALLSNCNFSDFQYWNLDQNESLRGKKAVFWVSCPNCTSQNLKIEFCITTCDVTKNFY